MYGCENCGSHAYSKNGVAWTYTGVAYNAFTNFTDGSSFTFPYVLVTSTFTQCLFLPVACDG